MVKKGQRNPGDPQPEAAPPVRGKIIIRPKRSTTLRLKLTGPTTLPEGRELAAKINSVVAHYNTLFWKTKEGKEILPKISARTEERRKR